MLKSNFLTLFFQVVIRFVAGVIFFPFWWYSLGFVRFARKVLIFLQEEQRALGFTVWLRNIFIPMYGQYDFSGRLISFIIRLFQIIVRGIALIFWALLSLIALIIWLALPFLLLIAIIYQLV